MNAIDCELWQIRTMDKQNQTQIDRNNKTFDAHSEGAIARDAWIKFYIEQYAPSCISLDPNFIIDNTANGALYEADAIVTIVDDTLQLEIGMSCYEWHNQSWVEV